jgi:acetyltransferase-like isoleucine patch superfamily enzyme
MQDYLIELKRQLGSNAAARFLYQAFRHPLSSLIGYLYGSYLTLRYVDDWTRFPAIRFNGPFIKLYINKGFGSRLSIRSVLIVQPLSYRRVPSSLVLGDRSSIDIQGDFFVGDDVQIVATGGAKIYIGGRCTESASGVSAKSLIQAKASIVIGCDAIIAQDTYITDSDWHPVEGVDLQGDVTLGDHVWVATGARILKGANIGKNCIVACGAVVGKGKYANQSLIAGVPARVVRSNVGHWSR